MDISKKLLFLFIASVCNITAMDKQNLLIGENACYQMLKNQFHQPFNEAKNKMQLGEYHGVVEETLKKSFKENLPSGHVVGNIETTQVDFGTDDESSTVYNSKYQSQYKLHFFKIPIINGSKTKHIYFIDVLPYEMVASFAEKIKNYNIVEKILDRSSLQMEEKNKILTEINERLELEEDDIIKQRMNLQEETENLQKLKNTYQEEFYRTKDATSKFEKTMKESLDATSALQQETKKFEETINECQKAKQELQDEVLQRTLWNRNLKYAFGTGFLTCGLLGLSAYYGHAKIDTFLNYVSSFWNKS